MKRLDPPHWVQKMTDCPFLCYHDSDTSIFSALASLSLLCCSWITPPISQRTQLIKTDKQAHLDPSEAAGGCIISPDKEKWGLGISDIVILSGRLRGNHRELRGLCSRGDERGTRKLHDTDFSFKSRNETQGVTDTSAVSSSFFFYYFGSFSLSSAAIFNPPKKSLINHKDSVDNQPASERSGAFSDWRARCFPQKLLETVRELKREWILD